MGREDGLSRELASFTYVTATRFRRLKRLMPDEIGGMHANASSRTSGRAFMRIASGNTKFVMYYVIDSMYRIALLLLST